MWPLRTSITRRLRRSFTALPTDSREDPIIAPNSR